MVQSTQLGLITFAQTCFKTATENKCFSRDWDRHVQNFFIKTGGSTIAPILHSKEHRYALAARILDLSEKWIQPVVE
jgi:hypothetical protein